jgi:Ni/Co efflux regulator RcnB
LKTTIFALAAGLIAISASVASAAPHAKLSSNGTAITQHVDDRDGDHDRRRHRMIHRDHDDRYEKYSGWHRYSSRPRRWHDRGCVAVGPIWFCP